jgi:hypothetical protein
MSFCQFLSLSRYRTFFVKRKDFESRIAQMSEFHERCPVISNYIRAIRTFDFRVSKLFGRESAS